MRFAVGLPNVGEYGDPQVLLELAVAAEESGWDGVNVWDHILYHDRSWPVTDSIVAASAMATATHSVRIGLLMLALPRRRPWKLAKELATLDRLSNGRLVAGFGLGSMASEYSAFGEDADLKVRAEKLDEGLQIVDRCLRGGTVSFRGRHYQVDDVRLLPEAAQYPRLPIWVAGRWPNRAPFRRAARWDGVMPVHVDFGKGETMPPEAVNDIRDYVVRHRSTTERFDLAIEGMSDRGRVDIERLARYERAGATWWVEALGWWRGDVGAAMQRIREGPTRPDQP